jgi:hypothetical protein
VARPRHCPSRRSRVALTFTVPPTHTR